MIKLNEYKLSLALAVLVKRAVDSIVLFLTGYTLIAHDL